MEYIDQAAPLSKTKFTVITIICNGLLRDK